jgi:hypothetical protein
MMKKGSVFLGAALLALALVFSACQNGTQEIEGDIGGNVGINYRTLSAPTLVSDTTNDALVGSGLYITKNYSASFNTVAGIPVLVPSYLYLKWKAGPGFEAGSDTFQVFIQLKDTNAIYALSSSYIDALNNNENDYDLTTDLDDVVNNDVDAYICQIKIYDIITASPNPLGPTGLTAADVYNTKVRFGIRAVPPDSYGGYRVPSAITWTGYFGAP